MKTYTNNDLWDCGATKGEYTTPKLKQGMTSLNDLVEIKPRCEYYHYSNPRSQGALICETSGFPAGFFKGTESYSSAYADRIGEWDYNRLRAASEIAGIGEQGWAYNLPTLPEDELKRFAKVALKLPCTPTHVRVVHWYNVATGYSCPTVEAIYPKQ